MITKIVVTSVLLLTIVYTLLVYKLGARPGSNSVVWNWWHRLVSTLVSVLLGVVVAVGIFGYQSSERRSSERARHLSLLAAEMSDIYRGLKDPQSTTLYVGNTNYPVLITYVQPLAIEDAARSGLFTPLQTENLFHVARKLRMFNVKTQFCLSVFTQSAAVDPSYQARVAYAARNVQETRAAILDDIDLCSRQIGFELSGSVNQ